MTQVPLEVSCREVHKSLEAGEDLVLLDCRETVEHEIVSISGAKLLPMSEIEQRKDELAGIEGKSICVLCHHGVRSAQVAAWLRQEGFAGAFSLAGGIDSWAIEIEPGMVRY